MDLAAVAATILVFSIPFGYWRGNTRKLSRQWFLAVHTPVPFIVLLRFLAHIPFELQTVPIFVAAFFFGQLAGQVIRSLLHARLDVHLSSCLVMDLARGKVWGSGAGGRGSA